MSGEEVLAEIRTCEPVGDPAECFQRFLAEELPALLRFARRFVGEPEEARDLAQDSLLRAHRSLDSFRGECSLKHWVFRILLHEGLKRQRRQRLSAKVASWFSGGKPEASGMSRASSPEQLAAAHEEAAALATALARLSPRQRAVVILRYLEGLSVEEIASLLETGRGSVKTHLVRAIRKLRLLSGVKEAEVRREAL